MAFNVVGIGELLWDLLPSGARVGGAPANFAFHAHELGASVQLISKVGNDPLGHELLARMDAMSLPRTTLQTDEHLPTGSVAVHLGENGIPRYDIRENCAWDHLMVTNS